MSLRVGRVRRTGGDRRYRRPVRDRLDELMRDAFDASDSGRTAEPERTEGSG